MPQFLSKTIRAGLAALVAAGACAAAQAAGYPDKPVHLIVPFGPGSVTDQLARITADKLGKALGQTVIVENKAGAGGNIGAGYVAGAPADGYTLLLGPARSEEHKSELQSLMRISYAVFSLKKQIKD